MKSGRRALGIAESFSQTATTSTLAGAIVRADRVADGFAFGECTVGGTDVTATMTNIYQTLDREDIQYLFLAGVALAWYNIPNLETLHDRTGCPVIAVTFESSPGLEGALQEAFSGEAYAERQRRYQQLPERSTMTLNGHQINIRTVGITTADAQRVITAYTPDGGRPEPLRVARLAARGARRLQRKQKESPQSQLEET